MSYEIYRLKNPCCEYAFRNFEEAKGKMRSTDYHKVAAGTIYNPQNDIEQVLEKLFLDYNNPEKNINLGIRSLSASDIVVIYTDTGKTVYYVNMLGFTKIMECHDCGFIQLGSTVDITDPCYDRFLTAMDGQKYQIQGRDTYENVYPGKYRCSYAFNHDFRVSRCRIVCADIDLPSSVRFGDECWEREEDGLLINVDSGTAGFFPNKPDFSDEEWDDVIAKTWKNLGEGYVVGAHPWNRTNGCVFLAKNGSFSNGTGGFWTCTGNGDGSYPLYVLADKKTSKFVGFELRFEKE